MVGDIRSTKSDRITTDATEIAHVTSTKSVQILLITDTRGILDNGPTPGIIRASRPTSKPPTSPNAILATAPIPAPSDSLSPQSFIRLRSYTSTPAISSLRSASLANTDIRSIEKPESLNAFSAFSAFSSWSAIAQALIELCLTFLVPTALGFIP